mmetsp:Transcript_41825/g.100810  ORF Transcript_41825/g.100810 Transcript_41825/m.100810 type:complete len:468 (+) Transcript_41825:546-1949(+)
MGRFEETDDVDDVQELPGPPIRNPSLTQNIVVFWDDDIHQVLPPPMPNSDVEAEWNTGNQGAPANMARIYSTENSQEGDIVITSDDFESPNEVVVLEVVEETDSNGDSTNFSEGTEEVEQCQVYRSPNDYNPGMEDANLPEGGDLEVPSASLQNMHYPPQESAIKPPPKRQYPYPTEDQTVEIVKLVVRHPRMIFGLILSICVGLTVALYVMVLSKGNPFSALGLEMDLNDVRSIHYDSLRMAQNETETARIEAQTSLVMPSRQSEVAESTYWVFEAPNDRGMFADAQTIALMKDTFDIFFQDEDFHDFCLSNSEARCDPPLSPLRMYYASSWDSSKVQSVIDDLKDPKKVDTFNSLGWCYAHGLNCENAPANATHQDINFVTRLNNDVQSIMDSWDMRGELIEDYNQATELAAYLMQTDMFKPAVDFGYDSGFSTGNLVSKYSRGIIFWGGPLEHDEDGRSENRKE